MLFAYTKSIFKERSAIFLEIITLDPSYIQWTILTLYVYSFMEDSTGLKRVNNLKRKSSRNTVNLQNTIYLIEFVLKRDYGKGNNSQLKNARTFLA